MFIVQSRYEYWSMYNGKTWTKWFNFHGGKFDNKEDAEKYIKENKKRSNEVDKLTKLKHEFCIIESEKVS